MDAPYRSRLAPRLRHRTSAADGVQPGAIGGLPDKGVGVDRAATGRTQLTDGAHVRGAVNELELALACGGSLPTLPAEPGASLQCLLDRVQPLGRVRMRGHVRARVMLQAGRVVEVERAGHSLPNVTYRQEVQGATTMREIHERFAWYVRMGNIRTGGRMQRIKTSVGD